MISVRAAVYSGKTFNVAILFDTINTINVNPCADGSAHGAFPIHSVAIFTDTINVINVKP